MLRVAQGGPGWPGCLLPTRAPDTLLMDWKQLAESWACTAGGESTVLSSFLPSSTLRCPGSEGGREREKERDGKRDIKKWR